MSDLLLELFHAAMDRRPYVPDPMLDKAEEALEEYLGQDGKPLLRGYDEAWEAHCWEDAKQAFYIGLALGMELGRLTPSAGACRRSG